MPKSSICADVTSAGTPRPSSVQEKEVNMRKPVIALAASAGVFTVVAAGAASLSVTGFIPQFGEVFSSCNPGGVTVTPHVKSVTLSVYDEVAGRNVESVFQSVDSVLVTDIDTTCIGQQIAVSISTDDASSYVATSSLTIAGSSAELHFDATYSSDYYYPDLYVRDITNIDVTIAGAVASTAV